MPRRNIFPLNMCDKRYILCVGLCCIDIINTVNEFPKEDTDTRCVDQCLQRGGNASNNCSVLSQLDSCCEFLGTLAKGPDLQFLLEDFHRQNIKIDNCVYYEDCDAPKSCVIINQQNGSRTILHSNKTLPELTFNDFEKLDLKIYKWIHFEGRNLENIKKMMVHVNEWNSSVGRKNRITLSLEIEKPRMEYEELVGLVDYLFIGKDFASALGFSGMEETVEILCNKIRPSATVICAWGDQGASAMTKTEPEIILAPPHKPEKVCDTLGAGDTFVAGVIHTLCAGCVLKEAINFGCCLAGTKCGLKGLKQLVKVCEKSCHNV